MTPLLKQEWIIDIFFLDKELHKKFHEQNIF